MSGVRERKGEAHWRRGWKAEEEKEGGGRPGIDRLEKGWIFLPLGGGPALGDVFWTRLRLAHV